MHNAIQYEVLNYFQNTFEILNFNYDLFFMNFYTVFTIFITLLRNFLIYDTIYLRGDVCD